MHTSKYIKTETLFFLTLGVLFAWSLSVGILSTTEFTMTRLNILFNTFMVLFILRLVFSNKFAFFATLFFIFVSSCILVVNYFFSDTPFVYSIYELLINTSLYLNGVISYNPAYELVISWGIILGFSLFVFIFGYLRFSFFILFGLGVVIYSLILTSGFFYYHTAFYVFIISSVGYLVNYLSTHQHKTHRLSVPFIGFSTALSLFAILISFVMPHPQEEIFTEEFTSNLIVEPLRNLNNNISDRFRPKTFSLAQTGFGGGSERRLGGNVAPNYDIVMSVRTEEEVLYLTGAVLDEYTGFSWVDSFSEEARSPLFPDDELNLEFLELQSSLLNQFVLRGYDSHDVLGNLSSYWSYDFSLEFFNIFFSDQALDRVGVNNLTLEDILNDIFSRQKFLDVDTLDNSTYSIFHTGVLLNYGIYNDEIIFEQTPHNGTIFANQLIDRNQRYWTSYAALSPRINIASVLRNTYAGLFEDVADSLGDLNISFPAGYGSVSFSDLLEYYLIPHANEIREIYTQLPEHFPHRVIDLAQEVTASAENDFEIAVLLENFLRQFPYTLSPGPIPSDRDFVDYFLFDVMMGYCTYYATAFVTMARSLGLPARYVEGFIAVPDIFDTSSDTIIRNRQGHAWAEVYFEGYGWYRFDPTPPSETFGSLFSTPASSFDSETNETFWDDFSSVPLDDMFWRDPEELLTEAADTFNNLTEVETTLSENERLPVSEEVRVDIQLDGFFLQSVLASISLVIVGILLRLLFIFRRNKKQMLSKTNNNALFLMYYDKILRLLAYLGYAIDSPSETYEEFATRLLIHDEGISHQQFIALTFVYQKAKFGNSDLDDAEVHLAKAFLGELETYLKATTSKSKYTVSKYLIGSI